MAPIFALDIALVLVAPLLRRFGKASQTLVAGAFIVLSVVVFGLVFPDIKQGKQLSLRTGESYLAILGLELPVLVLGLISLRFFKYTLWITAATKERLRG